MKRRYRNKEVHLTCLRCNHEWYAPVAANAGKVVHAPNRAQIFGARLQAQGSRMSPMMGGHKKGGYEKQLESMEARRVAAQGTKPSCPECGTVSIRSELVSIK